ncbi:DMT family transporter [Paenibacillus hamazuiensis]|uniref:DMT family transporter n=1 Tax=Paenibacillus hamazuiensis TaxID=2936508 RepID=UPI00200DA0EA|nr:DMT family transporter [Paenibacillus hamazuiensis]
MRNSASALRSKGVKLAYVLAVINSVLIGISFLSAKMTLDFAGPLDTLTFRFAAAFAILSIAVACGIMKLNYRGKPVRQLMLLSGMYPLGFFLLQTFGLQAATSAEGGIINAFAPVVTMALASVFLKETASRLQKLSTLLSVAGVAFIFVMKGSSVDFSKMKGIFLLLLAAVMFAGYSVLARSVSKHFSAAEIAFFMVGVGFAVFLTGSFAVHVPSGTLGSLASPFASTAFILLILYLGAVQVATAVMGSYVLSRIEAWKSGVFINLSTVVSVAAGAWVLGEDIAWYHLFGSALIIIGVIGTNLPARDGVRRGKLYYHKLN